MGKLLEIQNLAVSFYTKDSTVHAVNGISYSVDYGQSVGIVGESGCGKSVSSMSILKLFPMPPGRIDSGRILFERKDLVPLHGKAIQQYRGREIGTIFQNPLTSFNPVMTVGKQMTEAYRFHTKASKQEAWKKAEALLEMVGIPNADRRMNDYPGQFSGGMRQRVMIAMSLMCDPKLLIADEPTTALDVTIQAQIMDLLKDVKKTQNISTILISHDLGVVAGFADYIIVMYAGTIVEEGLAEEIYEHPSHPYTIGLLNSIPSFDESSSKRLASIPGMPPLLDRPLTGCPFADRCSFACEKCRCGVPQLKDIGNNHKAACICI